MDDRHEHELEELEAEIKDLKAELRDVYKLITEMERELYIKGEWE